MSDDAHPLSIMGRLADLERMVAELETRKPANAPWTYTTETHNSLRCVCSCGAVDNGNGVFYCNDCWPHIEGKVQVADNVISPVAALCWGVAVACGFEAMHQLVYECNDKIAEAAVSARSSICKTEDEIEEVLS